MPNELAAVIGIKEENCVNCHRCIAVCPAKMCNDGSKDFVSVNTDLCLGCGKCLEACTHHARYGIDDMLPFIEALEKREKLVAVVAPAVAANFEDTYLNLNGWLLSMGISACYDVSFGAELTVKSYLDYFKKEDPKCIIAQPCPALVSYVEIYRPDLISYLAPADSPMVHTIKMIKHFYPEYKNHRVVVISPCYAKKREFQEVGLDVLNVSFISIDNYLSQNNIKLRNYSKSNYDNPPAERAVLFSTPGGLMRTAERDFPGIGEVTRKIEGQPQVFDYLAHLGNAIEEGKAPIHRLIDCLNCERGCNTGPGTLKKSNHVDETEGLVENRSHDAQKLYIGKGLFHS
jgi:iron only hydrogenase large subunit-like protein